MISLHGEGQHGRTVQQELRHLIKKVTFKKNRVGFIGLKSEENVDNWLKKISPEDDTETINRTHLTSHCTRKGN